MIAKCACIQTARGVKIGAQFQDARYGEGQRVHTPMKAEAKYRCTICGTEKKIESAKERRAREKEEAEAKEKSGKKLAKAKN